MRIILLFFLLSCNFLAGQNIEIQLKNLETRLESLRQQQKEVELAIEDLKMQKVMADLQPMLPALGVGEEVVSHSLMALVYAEAYEQARWVGHIITPDVVNGVVGRTNDFRQQRQHSAQPGSAISQ